MTTYATRVAHVAIILLLTIGIMIVYAMPDQEVRPELNETCAATPTQISTPTPIPTSPPPQPTPTPEKINISVLSLYDRDNDGELNAHETGVVKHDYLHRLLTPPQRACAEEILEIVPLPIIETTPTHEVNASVAYTNVTPDRWDDTEQLQTEVASRMPKIDIGNMVERLLQLCGNVL